MPVKPVKRIVIRARTPINAMSACLVMCKRCTHVSRVQLIVWFALIGIHARHAERGTTLLQAGIPARRVLPLLLHAQRIHSTMEVIAYLVIWIAQNVLIVRDAQRVWVGKLPWMGFAYLVQALNTTRMMSTDVKNVRRIARFAKISLDAQNVTVVSITIVQTILACHTHTVEMATSDYRWKLLMGL